MTTYQDEIKLTTGELSITEISTAVQDIISESMLTHGIVNVFNVGSTASISTIEYEPGLLADFPQVIQKLIPKGIPYEHDKTWGDDNGHSHLRATILGPSVTVPFSYGKLQLGTWQQIVHIEFDHQPRNRRILVTVIGDEQIV